MRYPHTVRNTHYEIEHCVYPKANFIDDRYPDF